MTAKETEPSTSPPLETSSTPPVEDHNNQEDKSPLKDNVEVVEIVEVKTFHQEIEEGSKEDEGDNVDGTDVGTEVGGANNEAKAEAEAGVADRAEDTQPSERDAKLGNGHHSETKAGAEIDSQADNDNEAQPSEPKSHVDDVEAPSAEPKSDADEIKAPPADEPKSDGDDVKSAPADEPKPDADDVEAPADAPESAADNVEAPAEPESGADDDGTAEADGDEEEEKPRKLTVDDLKTAPMDFRFPTTNQAKHCFTRYIEYHKCVQAKGDDNPDCDKYARYYRSLCPGEWVDKWNEQRENGTFPGPL